MVLEPNAVVNEEGREIAYYEEKKVAYKHRGFEFSADEVEKALDFWTGRMRVGGNSVPEWFVPFSDWVHKQKQHWGR